MIKALAVLSSAIGILIAHRSPAPTLPKLSASRPADGKQVYDLWLRRSRGDSLTALGTMTVSQQTLPALPDSVIRRITDLDFGARGRTVDSTMSVARTLSPISERTTKVGGTIRFDINGLIVTGAMTWKDSSRTLHDTLPGPAFNSTDLAMVLGSLPLGASYSSRIPIYDPELGGYRIAAVRVAGISSPGDAWIVEVQDNSYRLTYRIDMRTRHFIEADIVNPAVGSEYRIVAQGVSATRTGAPRQDVR